MMAARAGFVGMLKVRPRALGCALGLLFAHPQALSRMSLRAQLLLAGGGDVRGVDAVGNTALHYAYAFGQTRAASVLEEHGGANACASVTKSVAD